MIGYNFNSFTITSEPYYDPILQQYKNILTTNVEPKGPLKHFVTYLCINNRQQSYLREPNTINKLVLISLRGANLPPRILTPRNLRRNTNLTMKSSNYLMTPNEIPDLITFLQLNNYQIETQITNMLNQSEIKLNNQKLIFTATYFGNNQTNICYIK